MLTRRGVDRISVQREAQGARGGHDGGGGGRVVMVSDGCGYGGQVGGGGGADHWGGHAVARGGLTQLPGLQQQHARTPVMLLWTMRILHQEVRLSVHFVKT